MQRFYSSIRQFLVENRRTNNDIESVPESVVRVRGGGSDWFYSFFVMFGVITTIVGLIVILLGSAGPSFGAVTAGIVLIGIGIGSTVCGIVNCL